MKTYEHEAEITLRGRFPLDMLRYDACCPATERDSETMEHYPGDRSKPKTIRVRKVTNYPTDGFTPARWQSFGCQISVLPVRKLS